MSYYNSFGSQSCLKDEKFEVIAIPDFVDIALAGNEDSDEAMYYLLHKRLRRQLEQRYKVLQHLLYDDFEDIVEDFFLYLREGEKGSNRYPYQSLRRIKKKEAFEKWLLNTFRNYLTNRVEVEERVYYTDMTEEMNIAGQSVTMDDELKLNVVSQLIAYTHQVSYPRLRFIFLRILLSVLNKQKAISDREMAEALGMTHIAYRVTAYRMKRSVDDLRTRLLHGEEFRLDEKHQEMARQINDDFTNLYPTLFQYYIETIEKLDKSTAVKHLRQQYLDERGFAVHEPDAGFPIRVGIPAFWGKLNRCIIIQ